MSGMIFILLFKLLNNRVNKNKYSNFRLSYTFSTHLVLLRWAAFFFLFCPIAGVNRQRGRQTDTQCKVNGKDKKLMPVLEPLWRSAEDVIMISLEQRSTPKYSTCGPRITRSFIFTKMKRP